MRFDLQLLGVTETGQKCRALITVYANSKKELEKQAQVSSETAAWEAFDPPHEPIIDGSQITVEGVEPI